MRRKDTPYHHGSHQGLLWSSVDPAPTEQRIDAIIVPTARPPAYLAGVAELARTLKCRLLTLHSGKWTTATAAARYLPAGVDLVAIDVPESDRLRLPDWHTSRLLAGTVFTRKSDLSTKRNVALMLGHMLDWSRVLFLDDDITGLNPEDVSRASGLLSTHNAVGLRIGGYPDHSVVCHAYREAGGRQQSFIGGGALAVHLQRCNSFFPDIYNDDWFFLLDGYKWLQPTAVTGEVIQYPYDPFRNPDRARAEEFGDVLAEGLYWLLDQDRSIIDADQDYWRASLVRRGKFIESVLEMVRTGPLEVPDKALRVAALKGSLGRLALITPELCHKYVQAWISDRNKWYRHVELLPTRLQLAQAVAGLSRKGAPHLAWQTIPGEGERSAARADAIGAVLTSLGSATSTRLGREAPCRR